MVHKVNRKKLVPTGKHAKSISNCIKKRRYESQRTAENELARMQVMFEGEGPKRAYSCPHCKGWHLTSRE